MCIAKCFVCIIYIIGWITDYLFFTSLSYRNVYLNSEYAMLN